MVEQHAAAAGTYPGSTEAAMMAAAHAAAAVVSGTHTGHGNHDKIIIIVPCHSLSMSSLVKT